MHWLLHLALSALSVLVVAKVLPGIKVKSFGSALFFALVIGVFNTIAWGLLAPLTGLFALLTLGVGALIVNGIVFKIAAAVVSGVEVSGFLSAILGSLAVTIVNWGLNHFLPPSWR